MAIAPNKTAPATVGIVGGGICGLACAISSAKAGAKVVVLERRVDPKSKHGLLLSAQSESLTRNAHASWSNKSKALELLAQSTRCRSKMWASRRRLAILDSISLDLLNRLGVDTSNFPALLDIHLTLGPRLPTLRLKLSQRQNIPGCEASLEQLLNMRDLAAQPSIGAMEQALRQQVDSYENIDLKFASEVVAIEDTTAGALVGYATTDEKHRLPCDLLIIADGTGLRSYRKDLNYTEIGQRETIRLEIRKTFHTGVGAKASWLIANNQWTATLDNGEFTSFAIRRGTHQGLKDSDSDHLLLEPPIDLNCKIQYLKNTRSGRRIIIAGDAAASGSPIYALGAQFALLWAHSLRKCIKSGKVIDAELDKFEPISNKLAQSRAEFEANFAPYLNLCADSPERIVGETTTPNILSALRAFTMNFDRIDNGGWLRIKSEFDHTPLHHPLVSIANTRKNKLSRLSGLLRVAFDNGAANCNIDNTGHLDFTLPNLDLSLQNGALRLGKSNHGNWLIKGRNLYIQGVSNDTKKQPYNHVDYFEVELPHWSVDVWLKSLMLNLDLVTQDGKTEGVVELEFGDNTNLHWGPIILHLRERPIVQIVVSRKNNLLTLQMCVKRGIAYIGGLTKFATGSAIGALHQLAILSARMGGYTDITVDALAMGVGQMVRTVDISFDDRRHAFVKLESVPGLPIKLNAGNIDDLHRNFFLNRHTTINEPVSKLCAPIADFFTSN